MRQWAAEAQVFAQKVIIAQDSSASIIVTVYSLLYSALFCFCFISCSVFCKNWKMWSNPWGGHQQRKQDWNWKKLATWKKIFKESTSAGKNLWRRREGTNLLIYWFIEPDNWFINEVKRTLINFYSDQWFE